jgi:hypothetical protein
MPADLRALLEQLAGKRRPPSVRRR